MTTNYSKLVRDLIPEIIEKTGQRPIIRILDEEEYAVQLNAKLNEEVQEYLESGEVEELADIAEVIEAILAHKGVSVEELMRIKAEKKAGRGGFEKQILLIQVDSE